MSNINGKSMKYWIFVLILLPVAALADQNDFFFYDTGGTHKYKISEASAQLSAQHGFQVRLFAIVVASDSRSQHYKKQFEFLNRLDAEKLSRIYISARSDKADNQGYYTDEPTAKKLLNGHHFMVIIYSPKGFKLFRSESVLTDKEIEDILDNYDKRR